jgi:hypothetical protein
MSCSVCYGRSRLGGFGDPNVGTRIRRIFPGYGVNELKQPLLKRRDLAGFIAAKQQKPENEHPIMV